MWTQGDLDENSQKKITSREQKTWGEFLSHKNILPLYHLYIKKFCLKETLLAYLLHYFAAIMDLCIFKIYFE